jgi:superfamily II DNA or RNA helicase
LVPVPAPLVSALGAGPAASPAAVARSIAQSLLPPEDSTPPPAWLLPGQRRSFGRVVAAVRRFGGAMLADPVGSGKTFVALAVAAVLNPGRGTVCLVPATLITQWRAVAVRTGVDVEIVSHEQVSRGRLPPIRRGLVVIDESHHYRNPRTRRYGFAAPWLVGRQVLLVTATPIVNRPDDLSHQLRLGIRDDALVAEGVVSIPRAIHAGSELASLARIVIEEHSSSSGRPARAAVESPACAEEVAAITDAIGRIRRLRLSRLPATATLVRGVLLRAAGSSAAALLGALRRYRTLLLHARDALALGQPLTRSEIRRFAGVLDDQLVMWEMMGGIGEGADLALEDLQTIGSIIAEAAEVASGDDPKRRRLEALLVDGRPSIVFTTSRDTVRYLRDRWSGRPVAWCTGEHAGLGHIRASRETVLSWFRAGASPVSSGLELPLHLIATDVAAEGLDLQRAARIVHYDAPWTPMRLEQREGRAVRLGSTYGDVQVVRFLPPPVLEAEIHVESALARKAALPARAGLGPTASRPWRWRDELAAEIGPGPVCPGIGVVRGAGRGVLAGFTLHTTLSGKSVCLGAYVGVLNQDGMWTEDREAVTRAIAAATPRTASSPVGEERRRLAIRSLSSPIRNHLAMAASRRWTCPEPDAVARAVAQRLRQAIQRAARSRDFPALDRLERALDFVRGGHTAGEAALVRGLLELDARQLARAVARLPPATPRPETIEARLSGVVLFEE